MSGRQRRARLYLVGFVCVVVVGVLWARLVQVQHVRHDAYRADAIAQREAPRDIPPARGAIFDRNGQPLALTASLCSVSLSPKDVKHANKVISTISRRLGISRREVRAKLRSERGFVWLERQCSLTPEVAAELSALDGVRVHREAGRVYPYDGIASKVVGFVGYDNDGRAGIELACDRELSGTPGREIVIRNGTYRSDRYYRRVQKRPVDGRHIYLTLDVVVQEIAEAELRSAVREHGARAGSMIVLDVKTGDILALTEYPTVESRRHNVRDDSLWTIRSISHVYEPGSTFKVVTAAALLETRSAAPADSFDAEAGRADLGFAVISDPHPHGVISLAQAFSYSSNIVMAKAARLLEAEEFYEFVRMFGFGEKTGVRLLGESAGSVPPVDSWSLRTQSTMAFGQEVAVTPLQMLNAVAAIANDGVMMMPRLIRGIAENDGGEVKKFDPVRVRRVVSKRTARTMQAFCRNVVVEGTGTSAAVAFMDVSGKTGTAQKASRRGGYKKGKYISSFIGLAPHDDPRIACLVILDEPRWASRYGGDSAAPVFAEVCRALANASSLFDEELVERVVEPKRARRASFAAPNFLRMDRAAALEHARKIGCNVLCQGEQGRVVAQEPPPGVASDRDAVIRLHVSDNPGGKTRKLPDLRGMDMREAKIVAARYGYRARFTGTGIVKRQKRGGRGSQQTVQLYCEAAGTSGGSR